VTFLSVIYKSGPARDQELGHQEILRAPEMC
jgi:hypothetical protein